MRNNFHAEGPIRKISQGSRREPGTIGGSTSWRSFVHWIYLALAILFEVAGTTALKAADGFTRPWPVIIVVLGYLAAFFFLGLSLKNLPVGIAYAIWAAIGMVLIATMGWLVFGEQLDAWAIAGIMLIVIGVVLVSGVSRSVERSLPVDPGSEAVKRPASAASDAEM